VGNKASDKFVHLAIKYFKSLILWREMRGFFEKQIGSLIQNMIVPGVKTDQDDIDLWQDEPLNFIASFL
jgi:hypothetical protein